MAVTVDNALLREAVAHWWAPLVRWCRDHPREAAYLLAQYDARQSDRELLALMVASDAGRRLIGLARTALGEAMLRAAVVQQVKGE